VQLSHTGKKWISVIVVIRPVFPDLVTYDDYVNMLQIMDLLKLENVEALV